METVLIIVIIGVVFTVPVLLICVVCIVNIVCCSLLQSRQEFCPRRLPSSRRNTENQLEQDDEETEEPRVTDLSEAPPPAYRHVEEYKNVDLEHAEVVRLKQTTYRLSSHLEPETESLPPDYVSNRGEDDMSERVSISVAPQQTPEGELPPTYSTAQLELMARRTAMGPNTITEMSIPIEEEESSTAAEALSNLRSETPVQETLNAVMQ